VERCMLFALNIITHAHLSPPSIHTPIALTKSGYGFVAGAATSFLLFRGAVARSFVTALSTGTGLGYAVKQCQDSFASAAASRTKQLEKVLVPVEVPLAKPGSDKQQE